MTDKNRNQAIKKLQDLQEQLREWIITLEQYKEKKEKISCVII